MGGTFQAGGAEMPLLFNINNTTTHLE